MTTFGKPRRPGDVTLKASVEVVSIQELRRNHMFRSEKTRPSRGAMSRRIPNGAHTPALLVGLPALILQRYFLGH